MQEWKIGENCFNECTGDLMIENYPSLKKIVLKKESLQNLNSLKICNCCILKTIETNDYSLSFVKNMIIESISEMIMCYLYLPNLQSFKTGNDSFRETTSLSLSSNSI